MDITLTGADERTDVDALVALARQHSGVEIGLLYTVTPEGRNRYPSRTWLGDVLPLLGGQAALHVCGGGARRELLDGHLGDLTRHAPRVQVNGLLRVEEAEMLATRVGTLITQHHAQNATLLQVQAANHCILLDGSGDRGMSPDAWLVPQTHKAVGFAGGLGPDNLRVELRRITEVAGNGAWVDMEGKRRPNDWFLVGLATE